MSSPINNLDRMRQPIDFEGMRLGQRTPMDIDALLEYSNQGYIIYEYKLEDAPMRDGQELALIRMANDLQRAGKETTVLHCSHQQSDPHEPIHGKDAIVKRFYYKGVWFDDGVRTVQEVMDSFSNMIEGGKHDE